jgi:hypothetical protein
VLGACMRFVAAVRRRLPLPVTLPKQQVAAMM